MKKSHAYLHLLWIWPTAIMTERLEIHFVMLLLPPQLLNALADAQQTAAKQSVFLPARSSSSKFLKLVSCECQITLKRGESAAGAEHSGADNKDREGWG